MTRNEALEKINKCIALATNAGATEGEKQNAWAMAEKLASKYGFKIVKQEVPKTTDINLNTVKEEPKKPSITFYKVSRFDGRIVARILFKLGYRYVMANDGFCMSDDQKFDYDAFKKLYKLLMKQYDEDLNSFKSTVYGWSKRDSILFKKEWIYGMGEALAGNDFKSWFSDNMEAGYNSGLKYRSYIYMIRKEVA